MIAQLNTLMKTIQGENEENMQARDIQN